MGRILLAAPAKLNLYLSVGPRRDDGYHDLVTVFQALRLCDVVELTPDLPFSVGYDPVEGIPVGEDTVTRAVIGLAERFGRMPQGRFHVYKRIPSGGGLGGGSADAAAALVGLCSLWGIDPGSPEVHSVAAEVGADCPFFLVGGCGLYSGRGDKLEKSVPAPEMDIVLVNPGEPVSTGAAYESLDRVSRPSAPDSAAFLEFLVQEGPGFGKHLYNEFTQVSVGLVPAIAEVIDLLRSLSGVNGVEMTGSGSTVFGLCESRAAASAAVESARGRAWWAAATRTSGLGARVISTVEAEDLLG